jgi:hypothetical protein
MEGGSLLGAVCRKAYEPGQDLLPLEVDAIGSIQDPFDELDDLPSLS